jgi:hypothetical protein
MASIVIRVGLGRSKSGKVLDGGTKWFANTDNSIKEAIAFARETHRDVFLSRNGSAYRKIKLSVLENMSNVN